jgi:hypothetical protein
VGGGDPGLAGAGGSEDDDLRAFPEGVEIVGLRSVKGLDGRKSAFRFEFFGPRQLDDFRRFKGAAISAFLLFEALAQGQIPSDRPTRDYAPERRADAL